MTQQEVIQKFMKSLDTTSKKGSAALDAAIKACSPFSSFKELKAALIRDCKNAKSADDFLKTYCGIDYGTEDNGAITGSDAGGSTTKTDESVVPESGSLDTNFKENYFTLSEYGITFCLYNRADSSLAESGSLGAEGDASTFVFRVNMNKFDSIDTSDVNGIGSNGDYLDRTLAHEFTHCVMAANIKYYRLYRNLFERVWRSLP